jgi:hypothetical protein
MTWLFISLNYNVGRESLSHREDDHGRGGPLADGNPDEILSLLVQGNLGAVLDGGREETNSSKTASRTRRQG